jgi:hypothetical protein
VGPSATPTSGSPTPAGSQTTAPPVLSPSPSGGSPTP